MGSRKHPADTELAPADLVEHAKGKRLSDDGRKLDPSEHVGARSPDTDADTPPRRRPRSPAKRSR